MSTWRKVLSWEVQSGWIEIFFPTKGRSLVVDFTRGLYYNKGSQYSNEDKPNRLVRRQNGQWWFLNKGMDGFRYVGSYNGGREEQDVLERAYQAWLKGEPITTSALRWEVKEDLPHERDRVRIITPDDKLTQIGLQSGEELQNRDGRVSDVGGVFIRVVIEIGEIGEWGDKYDFVYVPVDRWHEHLEII